MLVVSNNGISANVSWLLCDHSKIGFDLGHYAILLIKYSREWGSVRIGD